MFVLLINCTKGEPIHNVFEAFSRLAVTPTYSNIAFNKLEIIEHLTVLTFNKKNSIWNIEHLVVMSTSVTLTRDNKHVILHQYISSYSTMVHVFHFTRKCNENMSLNCSLYLCVNRQHDNPPIIQRNGNLREYWSHLVL